MIARLRTTADRLDAVTRDLTSDLTTRRPEGRWSINENVGHLVDLEELWLARLDDFDAGAPILRAADLQNRKTHEAGHNGRPLAALIAEFRSARALFVSRVDAMDADMFARTARHPRLDQLMSVVDHCFFIAEHDDHHLATIADIARSLGQSA